MKRSALVTAVALLAASITACGSSNQPMDTATLQLTARANCQEFVKRRLKAPSTAKFTGQNVIGVTSPFTVTGNVDSQNSYGATTRTGWTCITTTIDTNTWTLVSVTFS